MIPEWLYGVLAYCIPVAIYGTLLAFRSWKVRNWPGGGG